MSHADWVNAAIATVGSLSGVLLIGRLLRRPWRAARTTVHKGRRITAVLVGEDAIRDPDTGIVLRDAQPDLVMRLTSMQEDARATREVVERLADVHDDVAKAQSTADDALSLAKKALDRIDEHMADQAVHIPAQREGA